MSAELAQITQLLTRVGKEGDAASMAGSVHAKLEAINAGLGGGSDPGYLDGKVPTVYPVLAHGPSPTSGTAQWAYGAWVEIIPANTITTAIVIAEISTLYISAARINPLFELGVGAAGAEVLAARGKAAIEFGSGAGWFEFRVPFAKPFRVSANSRVAVRVADNSASALAYSWVTPHYYPLA